LTRQTGQFGAPRVITTKARPAAPVRRLLARVRRAAQHGKQPWPARTAQVLRTCSGQRCRRPRRRQSAVREQILPQLPPGPCDRPGGGINSEHLAGYPSRPARLLLL